MADGAVGVGSQVLQVQALGLQAVQLAAVVAEKADGVRAYAGGDGQQHTDVLAHHVEGGVLRCPQGLHTHERGHDAETREDCKGSDGRAQKCADAALRRPLITGQHVIQLALEFASQHGAGIEQQGDGGSHQHGHFGPLVEQAFGVEVDGHEVRGHKEGGHGDRDVVQQAALGAALFLDVVELFGHVGVFTHVHMLYLLVLSRVVFRCGRQASSFWMRAFTSASCSSMSFLLARRFSTCSRRSACRFSADAWC